MMKQHKWKWIVSSILILLPMLAGFALWNRLPDVLTTHWGLDGTVDGESSKLTAIVLPYMILLFVHWLCLWLALRDHAKRPQSKKALAVIFWILPVISLFCGVMIYSSVFGKTWNSVALLPGILGIMFLILGNYMPKIRQNHIIGIRWPWTFSNETNWNKTHRMCGRVWVIVGLVLLLSVCLPETILLPLTLAITLVAVLAPSVYSFWLYRDQLKRGEVEKIITRHGKWSAVVWVVILVAVLLLMVTGNVKVRFDETEFVVDSIYWQALTVDYDAIDGVEYLEEIPDGARTYGFGSARLLLGLFSSDAYGNHMRYTYSGCRSGVLIKSDEQILIINGINEEQTASIYEELRNRIG